MKSNKIFLSGDFFITPPPADYCKVLARKFGVNTHTVSRALRNKTCSRQAIDIRNEYMNRWVLPALQDYLDKTITIK